MPNTIPKDNPAPQYRYRAESGREHPVHVRWERERPTCDVA